MTKRLALIAAAALTVGAMFLPAGAANAQQVSVHIATPGIGLSIGSPYPPVYAPVYAPPVYASPVYASPVVIAPAPVYYPAPRYVAPPRVVVPAPVVYRAPWYVEHRPGWRHWNKRHHRGRW